MSKQLIVSSPAFENKGIIPIQYTGYGEDISPELNLSTIDENAKSLVIIMDDLNHPIPNYNHWIIWNIPVMQTIPINISHGKEIEELENAIQGRGYGKHRYRGPKPPFNWSHLYQYNVYALDCFLDLDANSKKRDLLKAMKNHVLQHGYLIGRYR